MNPMRLGVRVVEERDLHLSAWCQSRDPSVLQRSPIFALVPKGVFFCNCLLWYPSSECRGVLELVVRSS